MTAPTAASVITLTDTVADTDPLAATATSQAMSEATIKATATSTVGRVVVTAPLPGREAGLVLLVAAPPFEQ